MNTTKKSCSADNPAETTKASSTNGYANCFEVEYYSMSGGGIAGSTGCTRLVGRVLRGEFQHFQSAVLASENRGFNTLIASVWAHGTRTGNVVTSVGGRFTVIIDGVFSSLPTDCREATLAVLPGKSPWETTRSGRGICRDQRLLPTMIRIKDWNCEHLNQSFLRVVVLNGHISSRRTDCFISGYAHRKVTSMGLAFLGQWAKTSERWSMHMCLYWRERGTLLRKVYGRISTDSSRHRMLPGEGCQPQLHA